jgi:membrane protease YdiL (CAAX protease family)
LPSDPNPLIQKDFQVVPGWSILTFLLAVPVIGVPAVWLLPDRSMLPLLTLFFGVGLLAVLVAVAPLGWAAAQALALRPAGWRPVIAGVLGTTVLSFAVSRIGLQPEGIRQVTEAVIVPQELLWTLAVLALLAPLVEELVFRGLFYGWLAGRWGSIVALIASSLAFAAAHVEPAHAILVLPLGLWFGWLRRWTNSLLPSLVAHMVNNGVAVVAAAFLSS